MSDHDELVELFRAANISKESAYRKVEYVQVPDQNQGSYSNGQITYSLEAYKTQFSVLADSFIAIPFQLTAATAATKYAMKNSLLSLIQGVQVRTSQATILNENTGSTSLLANLRLLIDSTLDYQTCNELQYYGFDKYIQPNVVEDLTTVGGVQPQVSGFGMTGMPTRAARWDPTDVIRNPAMANRVTVFDTLAPNASGGPPYYKYFIAYIPLKFCHDWFAQMDFPISNCPFELIFTIAGIIGQGAAQCPIVSASAGVHPTLGAWKNPAFVPALSAGVASVVAAPALAICGAGAAVSSITESAFTLTGTRLWLKTVQFHDEDALKVRALLEKGFQKQLTFTTSQLFSLGAITDNVEPTHTYDTQRIGSQFVRPQRVWVFPTETGALGSWVNTFPSSISHGGQYITNANIMIDGKNFYANPLRSQYEFYKLLKEQCVGAGGSTIANTPISYSDFYSGVNPYVFDISRDPVVESNAPVELFFQGDVKTALGGNLPGITPLVLIESLETHIMDISMGGVLHTVKRGSSV